MSQSYKTGTVTVTAGQTSVVGSGTAWALALASGGLFCCQGVSIPCTVVDDTHLELDVAWPATSGAGKTYSIFRETAQAASAEKANDRLAEVADRLNKLSYINFDAMGSLAQRPAYDSAPKDFIFLDTGNDPFVLYIKASATSGDWAGPNPYGQGARGPAGADSTVPGPKGEAAGRKFTFSTTVTDANPGNGFLRFSNTTFASITSLFVSTTDGAAGGATEFLGRMAGSSNPNDKGLIRVQHADNPAIYREFVVTGVTTATSYRKVAVTPLSSAGTLANNTVVMITFLATGNKGTDGTGTGDVAGPASAVADRIAVFSGTTGKLLKDGGSTIAQLVPADGSVTNAKLANMATARFKGRATASTGAPEDLTVAQAWTMLDVAPVANIPGTLTPDKAFRQGNILGTVSQSGGVPTGAVIEKGSNANGEYVRFADGTQICTLTGVTMTQSNTAFVGYAWTFPAEFANSRIVFNVTRPSSSASYTGGIVNTDVGCPATSGLSTTSVLAGLHRVTGSTAWAAGGTVTACVIFAIGRWF